MLTENKLLYRKKPRIIYIFYDGIGYGKNDSNINPFTRYAHTYLSALGGKSSSQSLPKGLEIISTDAQLGIPGLPQSATGQTALWTGVNASSKMGRHITGFPGPTLIRIIKEYSIIKKMCEHGYKASLINAYSNNYLRRLQKNHRLRSASSHVQLASGQAYKNLEDLENGKALFMDYTHEIMHKIYPELKERFPIQSPYKRGQDLISIAQKYDLIIHEFFLTDKAGHDCSWEMAEWCIKIIESFIDGLIASINPKEELLLISSDHGNMEDLSTKRHSFNHVPTIAYGYKAKQAAQYIKNIADIPRFIYKVMGIDIEFCQ